MALPIPPANETITVYRGTTLASPYPGPGTRPVLGPTKAYVKHHMKNGRFGKTAANLHWTHKLFIPLSDIRDAYNAEMGPGPAEVIANADTILIGDYVRVGTCCAFLVVHVDRHQRGGNTYLVVYLDRFQPSYDKKCPKTDKQVQGTLPQQCCPDDLLPTNMTITVVASDCFCWQAVLGQTFPMTWKPFDASWEAYIPTGCVNLGPPSTIMSVRMFCNGVPLSFGVFVYCLDIRIGGGSPEAIGGLDNVRCFPFAGDCLVVGGGSCCQFGSQTTFHISS